MKIIAQLFGIGAMVLLFLVYQQKSRKKLITAKLFADMFWVIHYLLMGGIAGMIPNLIGIFREVIFYNRQNKKWANTVFWPIIFIIINWALGISTFNSVFNVLPIAASTFVTISLWLNNPHRTKIISLPVCIAFLIYNAYLSSFIGVINESLSICSIIIYLIKYVKAGKKK